MIPAATASLLLVLLQMISSTAAQSGPPPGCPTSCGDVSVLYPFGVGARCSLPGFDLTCDDRTRRLMLGNGTLQVVDISLANSTVRVVDTSGAVNITLYYRAGARGTTPGNGTRVTPEGNGTWVGLGSSGSRSLTFVVSEQRNQLVVTGCNAHATLLGDSENNVIAGCSSFCANNESTVVRSTRGGDGAAACSGVRCCQTPISVGRPSYTVKFKYLDPTTEYDGKLPLSLAVRIAERGWFDGVAADMLKESSVEAARRTPVPVILDWAVEATSATAVRNSSCLACRSAHSTCHGVTGTYRTGYVCRCKAWPEGNPYLADGCPDPCARGFRGNPNISYGCAKSSTLGLSIGLGVGSGVGLLLVAISATFFTRRIKHRRDRLLRQKFFKQNRGHLLQQLVFSQNADIAERMIIPLVELDKATNNFDKAREIGGGGHGTVYKGILSDLHVVAIKKSKVAIQKEIDEFINEVAILSQINHRNVVRLFGCCLETEVPVLVYEFISNGTLYHHLHVDGPISLPWEHRLRIATETARAIAYLHSAVSFPVIHRDIKSHNILLDGSLTAKVSDFGASRCIPADRTGITTAIQGTLGYLDPMYYYTGRLTEKSDVYSFGVVLIELLTRKQPYSYKSSKGDSLVPHFTNLLKEGNLVQIVDPQIVEEGGNKQVHEVAALASICVNLEADDRPTMRQVEMTLESIHASLQQVVLPAVATKISEKGKLAMSCSIVSGNKESSRQYSLEEEFLLSARYPR